MASNYKQIWLPRDYPWDKFEDRDKPTDDMAMIPGFTYQANGSNDQMSTNDPGGSYEYFRTDLSGSDNKLTNLEQMWRLSAGFAQLRADCKLEHFASFEIGMSQMFKHGLNEIDYQQLPCLPGYIGFRFKYRFPDDNARNFWSDSPICINNVLMHYYDKSVSGTVNQNKCYKAKCYAAHHVRGPAGNPNAERRLWPDIFTSSFSRRSNDWLGAYYEVENEKSIKDIQSKQMLLYAITFELKYFKEGGASHNRCIDVQNFTPVYCSKWQTHLGNVAPEGRAYRPAFYEPRPHAWDMVMGMHPRGPAKIYMDTGT